MFERYPGIEDALDNGRRLRMRAVEITGSIAVRGAFLENGYGETGPGSAGPEWGRVLEGLSHIYLTGGNMHDLGKGSPEPQSSLDGFLLEEDAAVYARRVDEEALAEVRWEGEDADGPDYRVRGETVVEGLEGLDKEFSVRSPPKAT